MRLTSIPSILLFTTALAGGAYYKTQLQEVDAINLKGIAPVSTKGYQLNPEDFATARITQVEIPYDLNRPQDVPVGKLTISAPRIGCKVETKDGSALFIKPDVKLASCASYRKGFEVGYNNGR